MSDFISPFILLPSGSIINLSSVHGLMMAEGRNWLLTNPWLIANAGIALMFLVLAMNLVGDGLRDILTPNEKV